ncbi:MerR family transcriptional regulator [Ornithinimicrobium sp. F0845]|uniref:MerR family transcriptional regulator n=1 Tax=Ornithinimicrobium sp. F0845 TaxID=2926412 RepID=UPI001FF3F3D6|nr:MerR family transcriptional regulator [Ornithinimicrobium sp. F0845]MCK0114250.1 MerR family transcriptional regulator [Ornithinimicrobium sp. F0845]
MEWSIQELSRAAGTTSRTLRYYGERGLITPSRTGSNGMRFYDESALGTLLRIRILRDYDVGLGAIEDVLSRNVDTVDALREHVAQMRTHRRELSRRIASLERTIEKMEGGEQLMADEVFEEFDHTQHREEVEQRWGKQAYADSDRWWRSLSDEEKKYFQQEQKDIAAAYGEVATSGAAPDSPEAQEVTARHVAWLSGPTTVTPEYLTGLGEMYVADPRFGANYPGYAEFVRDAMRVYAERM